MISMNQITEESLMSLFIRMYYNDIPLSTGTAFIVSSCIGPLLITNRHNVTGKNNEDNTLLSPETGAVPNRIEIYHNRINSIGSHIIKYEKLYLEDDFTPRWIEHPTYGHKVDFVALPLTELSNVAVYPYSLEEGSNIKVGVTDSVSVVGFPFGIQVGSNAAVWATGTVASEPRLNYKELPLFLIDCRSRQGQSGSPVIAYRSSGDVNTTEGLDFYTEPVKKFIGIYSGRINKESDLGLVWKASAIIELVNSIKKHIF